MERAGSVGGGDENHSEILDMDDRLGTLQAGKLADVLVVDGKPDENLDDLAKVELGDSGRYKVVEGGHVAIPSTRPKR